MEGRGIDKGLTSQQEEISTIKERNIETRLSDKDFEKISKLAGKSGMTIGELLENFIGDLVGGTYSNGSDERDIADQWYERCWFSHRFDGEEDKALLSFMLNCGYDVDDFLTAVDEQEYFAANPGEYKEEIRKLHGAGLWFNDDIEKVTKAYFDKNPDADIKKEIDVCRKWLKEVKKGQSGYGISRNSGLRSSLKQKNVSIKSKIEAAKGKVISVIQDRILDKEDR